MATRKSMAGAGSGWKRVAGISLILVLGMFAWMMGAITLDYWPPRRDAGFLQIKQQYLGIIHWEIAFWVHVATSMFALLAGFTQFSPSFLHRYPRWHRRLGRLYVGVVLLISGPASLIMAVYANGGISSRIGFSLLAVLWIGFTALGLRTAAQRNWQAHRAWMMRSYALTLSAITLRAWKFGIVLAFEPRPMEVYRLVAWLGFVPNLLVVEWLIRRNRARRNRSLH